MAHRSLLAHDISQGSPGGEIPQDNGRKPAFGVGEGVRGSRDPEA
ncbi:hypothetical protein HMPREF1979_01563 [Actinomyces johnsonii F0542]|uniref:Uncharacterized protein n=1 Tax=Actinomyces johnsonii F0542 TaxID=1321818 RepID=U1RWH6_9ACTO|nr:hypothetical protein HMPREF1979_01563 [Actinomyces johnsonii F0542]